MTPKEDQQPMTTREELVARAQAFVDRKYVTRADARQKEMGLAYVEAERQDLAREIARFCSSEALRLASRQEVSVEELADFLYDNGVIVVSEDEEEGAACALLAEYSITKRTTEG